MAELKEKRCKKDGTVKPISEFFRYQKNRDGYYDTCKDCFKEGRKSRRAEKRVLKAKLKTLTGLEREIAAERLGLTKKEPPAGGTYRSDLMVIGRMEGRSIAVMECVKGHQYPVNEHIKRCPSCLGDWKTKEKVVEYRSPKTAVFHD